MQKSDIVFGGGRQENVAAGWPPSWTGNWGLLTCGLSLECTFCPPFPQWEPFSRTQPWKSLKVSVDSRQPQESSWPETTSHRAVDQWERQLLLLRLSVQRALLLPIKWLSHSLLGRSFPCRITGLRKKRQKTKQAHHVQRGLTTPLFRSWPGLRTLESRHQFKG